MAVEHVEILVEEPSMEAALRILVPRLLRETSFEIYPHQCKEELLARLPSRLRGYRRWIPATWRIVVVVDRDDEDCRTLKRRLDRIAAQAGLTTKSAPTGGKYCVANRLAIEELEAWYFGDWSAVLTAYPRVPSSIPRKAAYRDPDGIRGGTWETFERVLQRAGYFKGGLRKIEAARTIAALWDPSRNRSSSFRAFCGLLQEFAAR